MKVILEKKIINEKKKGKVGKKMKKKWKKQKKTL